MSKETHRNDRSVLLMSHSNVDCSIFGLNLSFTLSRLYNIGRTFVSFLSGKKSIYMIKNAGITELFWYDNTCRYE